MKETFVLDASALIAFLNDEDGSDKVEDILQKAKGDDCVIYMNKLNILEIYYGVYREDGREKAEDALAKILNLPLINVDTLTDEVFKEAGRLKKLMPLAV
ncbi:MAG: PIN domain-containing protein [Nitrospirota bacterium]